MRKLLHTALLLVSLSTSGAIAADYAIIVNKGNSFSGDTESEIRNLFLKKKTQWPDGTKAVPLARSDDSQEQVAFNASILGMSGADLAGHWQAEKQKTGETPPKAVGSEGILFRQLKRKPGAFGIVLASSTASLPDGIKVLTTFEY